MGLGPRGGLAPTLPRLEALLIVLTFQQYRQMVRPGPPPATQGTGEQAASTK